MRFNSLQKCTSSPTFSRTTLLLAILGVSITLAGCGGDGEDEAKQFSQIIEAGTSGIVTTELEENTGYVHIRGTQQFTLFGIDKDGEQIDLSNKTTWSVSDTSLGRINDRGLFTPTGVAGEFTLTAEFGGQSHSQSIIVSDANLVSVTVSNPQASVDVCKNSTFEAEALFDNSLTLSYPLVWSLSPASDLASFTDSASPILSTYGSGSVSVVATGKNNAGENIASPAFEFLIADTLTNLTIGVSDDDDDEITLREGQEITVNVTATYADSSTADITENALLSVSSTSAASIDPVTGILTAEAGSYEGTEVTVTGTCDGQTAELVVNVIKAAVDSIEIRNSNNSTNNISITQGSSTELSVTATLAGDAGTDDDYNYNLEWSIDEDLSDSFNSEYITIDQDGRLDTDSDLNLGVGITVVVSVRVLDTNGNTLRNTAGEELIDTINVFVNP